MTPLDNAKSNLIALSISVIVFAKLLSLLPIQLAHCQEEKKDECGATSVPRALNYALEEHSVKTRDGYILKVHRLWSPAVRKKGKPYILLHDILGTSSSFIISETGSSQPSYYDLERDFNEAFPERPPATIYTDPEYYNNVYDEYGSLKSSNHANENEFAFTKENFEKKFNSFNFRPRQYAKGSNSLALTLANFGYDVWIPNLRGNYYSENFVGRYHIGRQEYWDFDLDTLIRHDLPSVIQFVLSTTKRNKVGLTLQPVVLMAPSLASGNRKAAQKWASWAVGKTVLPKNGAYPPLKRGMINLFCKAPLTRAVCHTIHILFGHGLIEDGMSRKSSLIMRDERCGRTSIRSLNQLLDNLNKVAILKRYVPWPSTRKLGRDWDPSVDNNKVKSIMVIHSKSDNIATMEEVQKIIDTSIKGMVMLDYVVKSRSTFDHKDFLYHKDTLTLVNANVLKMVALYDWLSAKSNKVARNSPKTNKRQ